MANEKRLIDANVLLKELRQELRECRKDADEFGGENILWAEGIEFAIDTVKQMKKVDAVEVVRCKDCTMCHYEPSNDSYRCSSFNGMYRIVEPGEYCSYGVRRPDDAV